MNVWVELRQGHWREGSKPALPPLNPSLLNSSSRNPGGEGRGRLERDFNPLEGEEEGVHKDD